MHFRLIGLVGLMAFLVALVTFAQPGNAQAALTLNNFWGCETNGTDEALASSGTPVCDDASPRSGDWSLLQDNVADRFDLAIITGGSTDSDNDFILGFGFRKSSLDQNTFLAVRDDSGGTIWAIVIQSDGDLSLSDAESSTVVTTTTTPLSPAATWYFIEIRWQHSASGAFDLHVNGSSEISETGVDLTDGGAISANLANYALFGDTTETNAFDDFYAYSGGTGIGDFLGDAEVFRYQGNTNSAVADDDCSITGSSVDLDQGVWQDLGETPRSVDATVPAFLDPSSGVGMIFTEDTQSGNNYRHGPHGDSNIDGDSNIRGGKWLHILKRSNGAGTTLNKCWGSNTDGNQLTLTLTTAFQSFFEINIADAPTSSEHCAYGFLRVDNGGRDILAEEIWCFILHVPDAGAARRIFPVQ